MHMQRRQGQSSIVSRVKKSFNAAYSHFDLGNYGIALEIKVFITVCL